MNFLLTKYTPKSIFQLLDSFVINSKNASINHFPNTAASMQSTNLRSKQIPLLCKTRISSEFFHFFPFYFWRELKLMTFRECTRNKSQSMCVVALLLSAAKINFWLSWYCTIWQTFLTSAEISLMQNHQQSCFHLIFYCNLFYVTVFGVSVDRKREVFHLLTT